MKKRAGNTVQLNASIPKKTMELLEKEMIKQGRTKSGMVSWILRQALEVKK